MPRRRLTTGDPLQKSLGLMMIIRTTPLAERFAAGGVGGSDPGEDGKGGGDTRVLWILIPLFRGNLSDLEELAGVAAPDSRISGGARLTATLACHQLSPFRIFAMSTPASATASASSSLSTDGRRRRSFPKSSPGSSMMPAWLPVHRHTESASPSI